MKPFTWLGWLLLALPLLFGADHFRQALSPRQWSFPRDHGRHDGFKLEWWYFTGNVHDSTGRRFGYQLTFFRTAFAADRQPRQSPWALNDLYFAHAAVSDIDARTFEFKDCFGRPHAGLAASSDQSLDVALLDWSAKMVDGKITLRCPEKNFSMDLSCTEGRGPILEGPGGVNVKGHELGQASYYYSVTRLRTAGLLTVHAKSYQVEGLSWLDHEFSSDALGSNQIGWDWMGLQLDNGTDLMIYRMRNKSGGTDYLSGTKITPDGTPHYLSSDQLQLSGSALWTSQTSGGVYPQQWSLGIAGSPTITVTSDMPGQELLTTGSTKVNYFEGSATVEDSHGKTLGRGYLEMTGYAK